MGDLAGRGPLGLKQGNPRKSSAGKAHMAEVAQRGCAICGARPVEVHHVICGRFGQRRASDFDTIGLCFNHHRGPDGIHTSKRVWQSKYGLDTDYL